MPEYNITTTDLRDAEAFLTEYMSEQVPDANFEVGSSTRDICIKAFASLYAFLRGEVDRVTVRQSLLRIQEELGEEDDIAQAVDEILSNWFVVRHDGDFVRMSARFHFTEKRAQAIPSSSRFFRTNSLVFYIDSDVTSYVISENQLLPVFDTSGTLVDYVVDVRMRAARVGLEYRVAPGTFVNSEVPGGLPYFSYAENVEEAYGGNSVESSEELIERAETALSVRNLINNRSCDATLRDLFPSIKDTLTIGMGEVEQIRDRRPEIGRHLDIHIGGHYDTYLNMPLVMVEESVTVGGFFVGWLGRNDAEAYAVGKRFYIWGMIVASVFGLGYFGTMTELMKPFMKSPAIWWLTASILLSAGSLHLFFKKRFSASGLTLLVSLAGMIMIRHYVRLFRLGEYLPPAPFKAQWSVIVMFIACLVIAVALLWYMLRIYFAEKMIAGAKK